MFDNFLNPVFWKNLLLMLPGFLLGIVLHEVAHGYVAYRLGDPTAKMAGRLTLNPIKHLDLVGSLVFIVSALAGVGFGWAKPVPIDFRYFKNVRVGMRLVSLAGPGTNFLLAVVFAIALRLIWPLVAGSWLAPLGLILGFGVVINVVLMLLNLLPIPPLDGGHILISFLPPTAAAQMERLAPWGMIILVGLILLGALRYILDPPLNLLLRLLLPGGSF
jgi:Zn-dependent protease